MNSHSMILKVHHVVERHVAHLAFDLVALQQILQVRAFEVFAQIAGRIEVMNKGWYLRFVQ